MLSRLRDRLELEIQGAAPLRCLNRWTAADVAFSRVEMPDPMLLRCRIWASDYPAALREARRAQCELKLLRRWGLPTLLVRLRARPVLSLGILLVLALALFLQNFVWFVEISGNERVSDGEILQGLYEEGVRFGAWGPGLDSEMLKNRMLNRIPALRWLAVNREGGVVTVLTAERQEETQPEPKFPAANLVASRDGLVRELNALNGFAVVKPGDLVKAGDLLISGIQEWSVRTQITCARGEVYADTLHILDLICPPEALEKRYTGREERCITIIFQRKRRKISGNSGIFGGSCDRMIETREWTLPGGFKLPITVETETLREYQLLPHGLSREEASALLDAEALRLVTAGMVAGQVVSGTSQVQITENRCFCRSQLNCLELISRTVPVELFGEEGDHGKAH